MQKKKWPSKLVEELEQLISDCISKFNSSHPAQVIDQGQKYELAASLEKVFGVPSVNLVFASRL